MPVPPEAIDPEERERRVYLRGPEFPIDDKLLALAIFASRVTAKSKATSTQRSGILTFVFAIAMVDRRDACPHIRPAV
jgi:hypothetical protein